MEKNIRTSIVLKALSLFSLFILAGCTENTTSPAVSGSEVAFWTDIDNSGAHSSSGGTQPVSFSSVDSIVVTNAGFGASEFELRNDISDSSSDQNENIFQIRTEQFLLAFDQSGRQYIGERLVPAGTYISNRFDLHPLVGNSDSLKIAAPFFQSLFGGSADNKTIVIKGFIFSGEQSAPFTYISTISGSERVLFESPLMITGNGESIKMIVKFHTASAFLSGGMLMDPRDGKNAATINANLKIALRAVAGN